MLAQGGRAHIGRNPEVIEPHALAGMNSAFDSLSLTSTFKN